VKILDNKKPENMSAYLQWLKDKCDFDIEQYRTFYEFVTVKIKYEFEKTNFWVELLDNLTVYNEEYQLRHNYSLFISDKQPKLLIKEFDHFLLKTYRKNVVQNEEWPNEPKDGWLLPSNWLSKINDIFRTMVVVKYLDGVSFLEEKIKSFLANSNLSCEVCFEAREEGYYACHLYTRQTFDIPQEKWDTERVVFQIELQITTQLQEVMRNLLHKYYEERRIQMRKPEEKWQWDYKSDEFGTNYLGHILHYVEGMIMEIREKQEGKKT
jgi:hypothetical protein